MALKLMSKLTSVASRFLEQPDAPRSLGFFRIAVASFVLLQATLWYPDWLAFFSPDGWMQWEISQALNEGWTLHISYFHEVLKHLGFSPTQSVLAFYWLYIVCGVGLLVGWHTRVWSVLTCVCHYVIMCSLPTFYYGVDIFLQMSLFYLMVMPVSRAYSLDARQKRVTRLATWGSAMSIRTLQLHLCLVYLSAGVEKLLSAEWRSGNALWRSLVQPDFRQYDLTWLAHYPWIVASLAWCTMILETGFFVAMWIPRLRAIWLAGVVALHLGIGCFLGLWLFGLIMIIMSISAFGLDAYKDARSFFSKPSILPEVLGDSVKVVGRAEATHQTLARSIHTGWRDRGE